MPPALLTPPAPVGCPPRADVVLARPCDGYPAGTHGVLLDVRQGCAVIAPDPSVPVAAWARVRRTLWVPLRGAVFA